MGFWYLGGTRTGNLSVCPWSGEIGSRKQLGVEKIRIEVEVVLRTK